MDLVVNAVAEVTANFAGPHLWAAAQFARQAHAIEQAGVASPEPPRFHDELQANVVASVLLAACAFEAWAGEIAKRPAEHFPSPFRPALEKGLGELLTWSSARRKYQRLAELSGAPPLDFSAEPDNAIEDLSLLRNKLVHFHPEAPSELVTHAAVSAMLARRCNRSLLLDPRAPHFPMAFASYDCARWAVVTVREFIERFAALRYWHHPWEKPGHAAKLDLPA